MAIKRLLLLSGAMCAGKSSIAAVLKEEYLFSSISSGTYLRDRQRSISLSSSRLSLQEFGDQLDIETNFSWLIDSVAVPIIKSAPGVENWLLDAVRKPKQVNLFRSYFGSIVKHMHLYAPDAVLEQRYFRREPNESLSTYVLALQHPNEVSARSLSLIADHIFNTDQHSSVDIAKKILNMWEV